MSLPASRLWKAGPATIAIGVAGLVVTAAVSWTAHTLNRNTEHRLLEIQTTEAAQVVASTIVGIQDPLTTAVRIESATDGDPAQFVHFMSAYVGPGKVFVSASLWQNAGSPRAIAAVGAAPQLVPTSSASVAFLQRAFSKQTLVVTGIPADLPEHIGYAVADTGTEAFAVYAERAIPANRQVTAESNPAFADLNFATYLGATTNSSDLATTDLDPRDLPLSGTTVRVAIPFGDTDLTLVTSPRGQLGGALGAELPWIFLVVGLGLTATATMVAERLVRRRHEAEINAETIAGLYGDLDRLYGEQRTIADTLQHALLPHRNPSIPELEIASRYVAGADGVDVGGDWYSMVRVDASHFAFVVGDVSGRGVRAATVMAQLRFTVRAYLLEGHPPGVVLEMCSRQLDISDDEHFATVLVGLGNLATREITLANAGHLTPLVISGPDTRFIATSSGPPLGIGPTAYATTSTIMPAGSTLLAFTDGLVERRTEDIDVGLDRLAQTAVRGAGPLDNLLTDLIAELTPDGPGDDIAILGFRWVDPLS